MYILVTCINGKVHLSFYNSPDNFTHNIQYANNVSGNWIFETVDDAPGMESSIQLNSEGKAFISYFDSSTNALKYASNISGSWVNIVVDDTSGRATSLTLDSANTAYISYIANELKFAKVPVSSLLGNSTFLPPLIMYLLQ